MTTLIYTALALAFAVSLIGTGWVRKYSLKKNILDIPNWRSSHSAPTPRGGGLAIVTAFLISSVVFLSRGLETLPILLLVLSLIIAGLGWCDDRWTLSAKLRLIVQIGSAAVFTSALLWQDAWQGWLSSAPIYVLFPFAVLFVAWMTNLYNFMDGIDGITSLQAITVCTGMAALVGTQNNTLLFLYLSIAFSCAGFLFWNWAPAKIFMGDVASATLGFLLATLALLSDSTDVISLPTSLILNGAFIVDATFTLFRRLISKEKITEAHRSHAYQHAAQKIGRHMPISLSYAAFNLLWLLPIAFFCEKGALGPWLSLAIAWLPAVWFCWHFEAGQKPTAKPALN